MKKIDNRSMNPLKVLFNKYVNRKGRYAYVTLTIFCGLLLFCFTNVKSQNNPTTITIDVKKRDKLNLSEIAADVKAIPLKSKEGLDVYAINNIFYTPNHLFVIAGDDQESNGWPDWALQYDHQGNFIKQLGELDSKTNEYLSASNMLYSQKRKALFIIHQNSYSVYDFNGKYKYSKNTELKGEIFGNKIYHISNSLDHENELTHYYLTASDLEKKKIDTIYHYTTILNKPIPGMNVVISDNPNMSKVGGDFFIIKYHGHEILQMSADEKIKVAYDIKLKNEPQKDNWKKLAQDKRFMFGDFIYYQYVNPSGRYCYLYNRKTSEGKNIFLKYAGKKQVAGIKDDIFNTGYINLSPTNSDDYVYFFKWGFEVKGMVEGAEDNTNPVIFLVKLK